MKPVDELRDRVAKHIMNAARKVNTPGDAKRFVNLTTRSIDNYEFKSKKRFTLDKVDDEYITRLAKNFRELTALPLGNMTGDPAGSSLLGLAAPNPRRSTAPSGGGGGRRAPSGRRSGGFQAVGTSPDERRQKEKSAFEQLRQRTERLESLRMQQQTTQQTQQTQPTQQVTQPLMYPVPSRGDSRPIIYGGNTRPVLQVKKKPDISINVKQIQNEKNKRRTKTVKKATKSALTKVRKRYTAEKKKIVRALRAGKKKVYDAENEKIKKMKPSARKKARDTLRSKLKTKLSAILGKIKPGSVYKNISSVESAISQVRKYKW
jgi:hypothetical protein